MNEKEAGDVPLIVSMRNVKLGKTTHTPSCQSYKQFTLVIYESRVVIWVFSSQVRL